MALKPIRRDLDISIGNLRQAWRNPRIRFVALAALAVYVLYAWVLFPTTTVRVRIGLDLAIDGTTRSASTVVELKARERLAQWHVGPTMTSVRGEAVVLSLGERGALVMLLTPSGHGAPDWLAFQVIAAMGGQIEEAPASGLAHVAHQTQRFAFATARVENGPNHEERSLAPDIIFLPDRRNPGLDAGGAANWTEVAPHAPDPVLGTSGATLTAWVETVARYQPVTRGELAARLPFFNGFWARNLVRPPEPPALRPANFRLD